MEKTSIYNAGRSVPAEAIKKITAGAYGKAGLSDINPQWRIEKMTELFGACGIGWTWTPEEVRFEENLCLAHITVRYKPDPAGEWSEPVHGYGGTVMGKMNDDSDVLKSTMTDAVSNALRYLGIGADVWFKPGRKAEENQFDTKYSAPPPPAQERKITAAQIAQMEELFPPERLENMLKVYKLNRIEDMSESKAKMVIALGMKEAKE